jgi:hypothetical protein
MGGCFKQPNARAIHCQKLLRTAFMQVLTFRRDRNEKLQKLPLLVSLRPCIPSHATTRVTRKGLS